MVSYEETRQKRVEENKKRMELLNLHKLSQAIKISPSKTKYPSNVKKVRSNLSDVGVTSVRRSIRTSDKPAPNYKEYALGPLVRPRSYRREPKDDFYASAEERTYSIERADYLESTLGTQFPAFVKPMLHSHVAGGFWLSLPLSFCKDHMPDKDTMVTLEDEDGQQWEAKYLAYKNGLSGGWRTFSMDHELRDGDALVFQLIEPAAFKVYIIHVDSSNQKQDEDHVKSDEADNATKSNGRKGRKRT